MALTYIFIRYVTVTLKRQEDTFYKSQRKIFSHESTEFNQREQTGKLRHAEKGFTPEEIFENKFECTQLIQERLGHANIQITLGTYGHLYVKSDSQVVDILDRII